MKKVASPKKSYPPRTAQEKGKPFECIDKDGYVVARVMARDEAEASQKAIALGVSELSVVQEVEVAEPAKEKTVISQASV